LLVPEQECRLERSSGWDALTRRRAARSRGWWRLIPLPSSRQSAARRRQRVRALLQEAAQPRRRAIMTTKGKSTSNALSGKTYGTVSAESQKEMAGLKFVQGLADGTLPLNMIAQTLGYDVTGAENGRVVVSAVPTAALLNPAGTAHGGFTARAPGGSRSCWNGCCGARCCRISWTGAASSR
jgi:hypothetical protein